MRKLIALSFLLSFIVIGSMSAQDSSFKVKVSGEGTPIIFLPGFTCPGEVWDATIKSLDKKYKTYQFTYAGFQGVPSIGLPWYDTISKGLSKYLEDENIQGAIIIGHSMGGMLAIDLASDQPDRIEKMILVDALPCIRAVMMPQVPASQISADNPYSQQLLNMTDSALSVMAVQMAQGMTNKADKQSLLVDYIMQTDREIYVKGYVELLKLDLREKLPSIDIPTLVLSADAFGKEQALKTMNDQYANLGNKEIKVAADSKHFIMFDQPEWFYDQVNSFLNQ
ncbi:alpha/beta fold hydrolase [Fulvivirga ligni]|uniref:alpha/beta fold hydrolase n=1 Tax=Fulvivirga ligni TaxID=2904246 RepID=UPI001F38A2D5|nr:alpha/beta hydrolase [Fulvivirga ligni]UII21292.1 alpha/beta hydrolase [Fulvivirga ligni]